MVGVEEDNFVDAEKVFRVLNWLEPKKKRFIDFEMQLFLQSYGKRQDMRAGAERAEYVLSKLGTRPVYYIWTNKIKS